jgi:predicted ATP-binding protein involved in virulence
MEALREASVHTQVIVTTHSPDLLDHIESDEVTLLVVDARGARSRIATADQASVRAIQEHLYSPGDLLRMDQLQPDDASTSLQEVDVFASAGFGE